MIIIRTLVLVSAFGSANIGETCSELACSNFCGNGTRSGYIGGQWCQESCNLGECGYYVVEKDNPYDRCQNETYGTLAGEWEVWYRGAQRSTNMWIYCDLTVEQPKIFDDQLHFDGVKDKCTNSWDSKATMYILDSHGIGKYECVWIIDENTISGSHYTGPNRYWGTIEYRRISTTSCSSSSTEWNNLGLWNAPDECQEACTSNPDCNWFIYNFNNTRCTSFQSCRLVTAKINYRFEIQAKMLEGKTLASKLNSDLECLELITVNESSYFWPIWVDSGTSRLTFNVSWDGDLYLALGTTTEIDAPHFEIKIAGDSNSSEIRDLNGSIIKSYSGMISHSWHSYWIVWESWDLFTSISVGWGDQPWDNTLMTANSSKNYLINVIGLGNTGNFANWSFGCGNKDIAIITWEALLCCTTATNAYSSSTSVETIFGLPGGSVQVVSYFIAAAANRSRDENSKHWNMFFEIHTDFYASSDIENCLSNSDCLTRILDEMELDLGITLDSLSTIGISTSFIEQNHEEFGVCMNNTEITKPVLDNLVSLARSGTKPCISDSDCSGTSDGVSEICDNFVCSVPTTF